MAAIKTVVFTDTLKIVPEYQTICFKKRNIISASWGRAGRGGRRSPPILTRQHIFVSVFVQILRQLCKGDGQTGLLSVELLYKEYRSEGKTKNKKPALQKTAREGVWKHTLTIVNHARHLGAISFIF